MSEDKSPVPEKDGTDLSTDELEAVSGGTDRDWATDGCAATVEPGSWCGTNDNCVAIYVTYDHEPEKETCPECGSFMYIYHTNTVHAGSESKEFNYYRCPKCGYEKKP